MRCGFEGTVHKWQESKHTVPMQVFSGIQPEVDRKKLLMINILFFRKKKLV